MSEKPRTHRARRIPTAKVLPRALDNPIHPNRRNHHPWWPRWRPTGAVVKSAGLRLRCCSRGTAKGFSRREGGPLSDGPGKTAPSPRVDVVGDPLRRAQGRSRDAGDGWQSPAPSRAQGPRPRDVLLMTDGRFSGRPTTGLCVGPHRTRGRRTGGPIAFLQGRRPYPPRRGQEHAGRRWWIRPNSRRRKAGFEPLPLRYTKPVCWPSTSKLVGSGGRRARSAASPTASPHRSGRNRSGHRPGRARGAGHSVAISVPATDRTLPAPNQKQIVAAAWPAVAALPVGRRACPQSPRRREARSAHT